MNAGPDFEAARAQFERGVSLHAQRRWDAAAAAYRESLRLLPGRPSTLTNLGAALLELGQPAAALERLDEALAVEPGNAEAAAHRGAALAALGRDGEALAAFDAVPDAARSPACHVHRALCLARLDRLDDALAAFDAALALDEHHAEAWARRGGLLKDLGRPAQAIASLQRGIDLGADAELNGYLLASLGGGTAAPRQAPAAYVQQLFDAYAGRFDEHLVARLDYRVPAQLAALAARLRPAYADALDLGCGTGLCAAALSGLVAAIDGVDLSAGMLERARAGGRYRTLTQADLAEHLAACGRRYALVVAADVFIYVGALEAVFAGVARVLAPGGVFCFSVERAEPGAGDHPLGLHSRYAHAEPYLRRLAADNGLAVAAIEPATLRSEQRQPVAGLLCAFGA